MNASDRRFAEALLRALRGMRHAMQAAETAVVVWMRDRGAAVATDRASPTALPGEGAPVRTLK